MSHRREAVQMSDLRQRIHSELEHEETPQHTQGTTVQFQLTKMFLYNKHPNIKVVASRFDFNF